MGIWGVRAGASGEREAYALEHGVAVIGWDDVPDLRSFAARDELKQHLHRAYPDQPVHGLSIWSSQLWAFSRGISDGDLLALPRKGTGTVALGVVSGSYVFDVEAPPHARHRRCVNWVDRGISTAALDDDIRYSLRSLMTVFRVRPDGAENRLRALLEGETARVCPVDRQASTRPAQPAMPVHISLIDSKHLAELATRQIRDRIGRTFKAERFERLVAAVLEAGGLRTLRTSGGRDGGIDIVAQGGPFGFGEPMLAVQVKSTAKPVGQRDLDAFCSAAMRYGSGMGLFVSWGGFATGRQPETLHGINRESIQHFFSLRQWDADQLVDELLRVYDQLDGEIQQELPLRRFWSLADEAAAYVSDLGPQPVDQ